MIWHRLNYSYSVTSVIQRSTICSIEGLELKVRSPKEGIIMKLIMLWWYWLLVEQGKWRILRTFLQALRNTIVYCTILCGSIIQTWSAFCPCWFDPGFSSPQKHYDCDRLQVMTFIIASRLPIQIRHIITSIPCVVVTLDFSGSTLNDCTCSLFQRF